MIDWIVKAVVILFAITIHEYAHGRVSLSLGDPTALYAGRLTLNPLKHIDPIGMCCLFIFNFGWARPVPINPMYFKRIRRDMVLISLSGPFSNLLSALIGGILIRSISSGPQILVKFLLYFVIINVGLGLFNLIPIPPLDGSHVVESLIPERWRDNYLKVVRFGPILLILIIFSDYIFNIKILNMILLKPIWLMVKFLVGDNIFIHLF